MNLQKQFLAIVQLIQKARTIAYKAVNAESINLYWQVGEYISKRVASASWGDKTVEQLAGYIQKNYPDLKGYNRRGLYRMKQFYETYVQSTFVSPLATQIQLNDDRLSGIAKVKVYDVFMIFRCLTRDRVIYYLDEMVNAFLKQIVEICESISDIAYTYYHYGSDKWCFFS